MTWLRNTSRPLFLCSIILLLIACSPHPVSGVWTATQDNEYGITRIVLSFDGKAEFVTSKLDNATWHCFWGATASREANLDCSSSIKTDQAEIFKFIVNEQGMAELQHKLTTVALFTPKNENPML